MPTSEDEILLRVFLGESDKHHGRPLYEAIVLKARELHLAGATVVRGIMGYGQHSRVHTAKILRLSEDLPVIVEIVDREEKIQSLLSWLDEVVGERLVTIEHAEVLRRGEGGRPKRES
jgi:uncharacterized protein